MFLLQSLETCNVKYGRCQGRLDAQCNVRLKDIGKTTVREFCKNEVVTNKTASTMICAPVNNLLSQSKQKQEQLQEQCEQKQEQCEQKQEQCEQKQEQLQEQCEQKQEQCEQKQEQCEQKQEQCEQQQEQLQEQLQEQEQKQQQKQQQSMGFGFGLLWCCGSCGWFSGRLFLQAVGGGKGL